MALEHMAAIQLTGHGGIDKLLYREDVPVPRPGSGQVLVKVTATAKNNTDRKVRKGLYPVGDDADVTSLAIVGTPTLTFPRIQSADVAGQVAAVRPLDSRVTFAFRAAGSIRGALKGAWQTPRAAWVR